MTFMFLNGLVVLIIKPNNLFAEAPMVFIGCSNVSLESNQTSKSQNECRRSKSVFLL